MLRSWTVIKNVILSFSLRIDRDFKRLVIVVKRNWGSVLRAFWFPAEFHIRCKRITALDKGHRLCRIIYNWELNMSDRKVRGLVVIYEMELKIVFLFFLQTIS